MSLGIENAPTGWDARLDEVARALPSVLDDLRRSYAELAERAAHVEAELRQANRERDELTERLHAADKLAALGTMAAGIAHEIRNPLNGVRGFAELLDRRHPTDERSTRWAHGIVAGVGEIDAIVENLLSFGSPQKLRLESVEPRELLESAARLCHWPESWPVGPRLTVEGSVPTFQADRIKLRQALRNLVENAVEAQSSTGVPVISVSLAREDDQLVFRVADAGPGVPVELRSRILDPFFTTHADGTGLGLALVSVIARLHGGTVQVSNRPSALGGALFVLRIPFKPAIPAVLSPTHRS
jgi:two-component system sensor histidine kinase HydH